MGCLGEMLSSNMGSQRYSDSGSEIKDKYRLETKLHLPYQTQENGTFSFLFPCIFVCCYNYMFCNITIFYPYAPFIIHLSR